MSIVTISGTGSIIRIENGVIIASNEEQEEIFGSNRAIVGNHKIVWGNNCTVTGNHNVIHGHNCTVTGNHNTVNGDLCRVVGNHNKIHGANCGVVGNHNNTCAPPLSHMGAFNQVHEAPSRPVSPDVPRDHKTTTAGAEEAACNVCMDKRVDARLHPCGHTAMCMDCAITVYDAKRVCPVCREPFRKIHVSYL